VVPSHVGHVSQVIKKPDRTDVLVIEAMWHGVVEQKLSKRFKNGVTLWLARPIPPREITKGIQFAATHIGQKYDYLALMGIYLKYFLHRYLSKKSKSEPAINKYLNNRNKFFCSELTEEISDVTGKRYWHGPKHEVTPYDQFRSRELDIYASIQFTDKGVICGDDCLPELRVA